MCLVQQNNFQMNHPSNKRIVDGGFKMKISAVQANNTRIHQEVVKTEQINHEHLNKQRIEKLRQVDTEEKRIEANRRMNRAGQNVDKLA